MSKFISCLGGDVVSKKCAGCGTYFSGELNGDYLCPACARLGALPLRPLSTLDGLDGIEAQAADSPRRPMGSSTGSDSDGQSQVKGQAA